MKTPDSPEDWKRPERHFYQFHLDAIGNMALIATLITLVDNYVGSKGNATYLKADLKGHLWSEFYRANAKFQAYHKCKKYSISFLWPIVYWYSHLFRHWYHRVFKTKYYKGQILMMQLTSDIKDEL